MIKHTVVVVAFLLLAIVAAGAQVIGGSTSLSVSSSTATVPLPAAVPQFQTVVISPSPSTTQEVFYQLGPATVAAYAGQSANATISLAAPGVVTWTGSNLVAGEPVVFRSTGTLPFGITAGTTYYVLAAGLTSNSFQVSLTAGGTAVVTGGPQSGVHTASAGSAALPSGGICVNVGNNQYLAAITATGTATLRLTQLNTCAGFSGASAAGSSGGTVNQGTSPWVVGGVGFTPAAFSGAYSIAVGGTAQQLSAAAEVANDCLVQNPQTATAQGIATAESLFVNFVTTATLLSGGTTIELAPGTAISCGGKTTLAISVNAATTGHKLGGNRR